MLQQAEALGWEVAKVGTIVGIIVISVSEKLKSLAKNIHEELSLLCSLVLNCVTMFVLKCRHDTLIILTSIHAQSKPNEASPQPNIID